MDDYGWIFALTQSREASLESPRANDDFPSWWFPIDIGLSSPSLIIRHINQPFHSFFFIENMDKHAGWISPWVNLWVYLRSFKNLVEWWFNKLLPGLWIIKIWGGSSRICDWLYVDMYNRYYRGEMAYRTNNIACVCWFMFFFFFGIIIIYVLESLLTIHYLTW